MTAGVGWQAVSQGHCCQIPVRHRQTDRQTDKHTDRKQESVHQGMVTERPPLKFICTLQATARVHKMVQEEFHNSKTETYQPGKQPHSCQLGQSIGRKVEMMKKNLDESWIGCREVLIRPTDK